MSSTTPHVLVTGGAGFIGSHFTDYILAKGWSVTVVDALTYAGNRKNLDDALAQERCTFEVCNITEQERVFGILQRGITHVVHLAAESHVDNSIASPKPFIDSNVMGSFHLLEACRTYLATLNDAAKDTFRFVYVSTDEVYGALGTTGHFTEASLLAPNSPYSASKAAADHLVRAWGKTYGLPVITTHCGNNYGPRQFSEKFIPTVIRMALSEQPIPIYGDGRYIREWIHVSDHCDGLFKALTHGRIGGIYNFSGRQEMENIVLAQQICAILDDLRPRTHGSYAQLIAHVTDRAAHDARYAIDDRNARDALGFSCKYDMARS